MVVPFLQEVARMGCGGHAHPLPTTACAVAEGEALGRWPWGPQHPSLCAGCLLHRCLLPLGCSKLMLWLWSWGSACSGAGRMPHPHPCLAPVPLTTRPPTAYKCAVGADFPPNAERLYIEDLFGGMELIGGVLWALPRRWAWGLHCLWSGS